MQSYATQNTINIAKVLITYVKGFACYQNLKELQNIPRRRLPLDHKTQSYPLRASTIEEASTTGNLLVHDDIYLVQLDCSPEDLDKYTIPAFNDQLTNAWICGGQAMRNQDLTPWTRREIFQLSFSVFHLTMNLIWALLHVHHGTINQYGSLSHFFAVLEKVRLGAEHPNFHTLLTTLTQILNGLILNAWRDVCGFSSLDVFAESHPTTAQILKLAGDILKNYATPTENMEPSKKPSKAQRTAPQPSAGASSGESESSGSDSSDDEPTDKPPSSPVINITHENIIQLMRDLLYVIELVCAVSDGDFGQIEDILPDLACIFHGTGSNNYATEILHLLFNIKEVWTPEFAYVIIQFSKRFS
ncbi:hypothetical protein L208DRAFT_1270506 [Tricholoma matsutake]|nr:hypothetical protein L208DRAFT_1270506 [Tricholoma matsutake 945]